MMRYASMVILAVAGFFSGQALHDVNRQQSDRLPVDPAISSQFGTGDTVASDIVVSRNADASIEWTRIEQSDDSLSHWMYVTAVPNGWLVKTIPSRSDDGAYRDHLIFVPDERHDWIDLD